MFVYMLASKPYGTLYIGVSNDLTRRVAEHKAKLVPGFTNKYNITRLVFYEQTEEPGVAIAREKQLKNWHRDWKINLIERSNPHWEDLYPGLLAGGEMGPETSSG